ncbi:MAG: phosphotriesterase-related protein [Firmicutes bacterium]|nr:phosphotriesterase-related protein [Bacillota bacterium]
MKSVMTVLGPVDRDALGVTLPHEHVQIDLSALFEPPENPARAYLVESRVSRDLYPVLVEDPYQCQDNMLLDEPDVAARELLRYRDAGGRTLVDLSTRTIGPYPTVLRDLARRTGLNIVAGTGYYVERLHPTYVADVPYEALRDEMRHDLEEGFFDTGVRAGILGELGTSSPVRPDEVKVLRAAAAVQRVTGVGINVHLAIFAAEGLRVLDLLETFGADLSRVALSHLDEHLDPAYHRAIAKRGAFLSFDTFGSECEFRESGEAEPKDGDRLVALERLLDAGHVQQVLLAQDVCTKMQWRHYGGKGYDHVLSAIVPQLLARGVPRGDIETMLVHNPTRLLAGH